MPALMADVDEDVRHDEASARELDRPELTMGVDDLSAAAAGDAQMVLERGWRKNGTTLGVNETERPESLIYNTSKPPSKINFSVRARTPARPLQSAVR